MFGTIRNAQGEKLDYTFHPGSAASKVIVVLGHGVTGNKDRAFVMALAEGLATAGIPALRFSFSGNGASEGRFVDSTITKEVADLGAVLDALKGHTLGYVGHSMGGAVGVLRASQDARIGFLVSLAGMVHTADFAQREFGMVTPGGSFMWDDESCPLSQAYMDDLTGIVSVVDHAPAIRVPWLLVHGNEDDVVPLQDSRDMLARANAPKELCEIPGAGHVFSGEATAVMVEKVVGWVKGQIG
ncbi:MAG: alpha/beta fold hydrolase [Candidatus Latescibacteria bacterium]|nr:alpha/beta fold hydrolase [Candidatus Latescibacterota bacterium]